MITIILTYRNRALHIVKNSLEALAQQTNTNFKVLLVDYGSLPEYKNGLAELTANYEFVTRITCDTQQQLWCKCRAINIALKQVQTPYVFVGDMDMIYHPECVDYFFKLKSNTKVTYFQVGFLNEKESTQSKAFADYTIEFKSQKEATGMTLFPTEALESINGYDEFYNGWGSEDTDVHVRLQNANIPVEFYTETILMLHQWHPKNYRTKNDVTPFHTNLEQINQEYLKLTASTKKVKANTNFDYGSYNPSNYEALSKVASTFKLTNKEAEVKAFINNVLLTVKNEVIQFQIKEHSGYKSIKQSAKLMLGKKTISFLDLQTINNMLLEVIISNLRDKAYQFFYNTKNQTIIVTIKL
ncbi:glycosyltransferase family 2 protein [Lacinutrix salivirga]